MSAAMGKGQEIVTLTNLPTSGRGEDIRKWCKYCALMYVNGKMRSVETIPGMSEEE
jgi:hypothetical protein